MRAAPSDHSLAGPFATQKQALNALVFLFRESLGRQPGDLSGYGLSRRPRRLPGVLSREECQRLFAALEGTTRLMAELMYGSGLRLNGLLRLRVKDLDLERGQLIVRGGKGDEDRATNSCESYPDSLTIPIWGLAGATRELFPPSRP